MKKRLLLTGAVVLILCGTALAAEIPEELLDALPREAETLLEGMDLSGAAGLSEGLGKLLKALRQGAEKILRQRMSGAAAVLAVVILCGAVRGFSRDTAENSLPVLPLAGGAAIAVLTAGSLDTLIGLGVETIQRMEAFSEALLPALAAAAAAGGMVSGAAAQQVGAVLCVDLLLSLIRGILLPALYLYIGTVTAGVCLTENRLQKVAEAMKVCMTRLLTVVMAGFTLYLSVVRVVSGTADGVAVRMTKTVIAGVVPIVGGILSEASETLLAGAGMLRNTIGVFGMLAVLAVCLYPFVQLGMQYLLYKTVAFLAEVVGTPELCRLISGLGGAFGLMLGMVGACALLIVISILAAVSMTVV